MRTAQVVTIEVRARGGLERSDLGAQNSDPTRREGISVMTQHQDYETKRAALRERFQTVSDSTDGQPAVGTGGVDHLALICSDLVATVEFYTGVLKMRLVKVVPNRDDETSTHIFLDMGGGNLLAFFDFPGHGPTPTKRGVGSMHHLALKASSEDFACLLTRLDEASIEHSVHGGGEAGSVYVRDPDGILVEVTTGY